jgi:hypothetical protein
MVRGQMWSYLSATHCENGLPIARAVLKSSKTQESPHFQAQLPAVVILEPTECAFVGFTHVARPDIQDPLIFLSQKRCQISAIECGRPVTIQLQEACPIFF